MTEFQRRVVTALLGAPAILLLIIFAGRPGAALFAFALSAMMLLEYTRITLELSDAKAKSFFAIGFLWFIHLAFFWGAPELELMFISFFVIFLYFLFTSNEHAAAGHLPSHFRELPTLVFGFTYLGFLPLYIPMIRAATYGDRWLILCFVIVWAADTGAYFSGLKYGKRKLFEVISPKKSWEGALGGLASAVVVTLVYKLTLLKSMGWGAAIFVPLLVASASILGDLCESFLKRAFATKDSGSLLPGHGGFLDRFDGVLFGLPVMYACVRIFG